MKNDFITHLITQKKPVYILSPHFDDAFLSCGQLMMELHGKVPVTVINVFTKAGPKPYTISIKQALKYAGFTDAEKLYEARLEEDTKALQGLVEIINLDLPEALHRKNEKHNPLARLLPEFDYIYPTYKFHIVGKPKKSDPARQELRNKLYSLISADSVVIAPSGIGSHVDHVLVKEVAAALFKHCVFYSDFPYNIREDNYGKALPGQTLVRLYPDMAKKQTLLQLYRTQFTSLFPEEILPKHTEVYFVPNL